MLQSLFNHLREAQARQEVKAIVITGANGAATSAVLPPVCHIGLALRGAPLVPPGRARHSCDSLRPRCAALHHAGRFCAGFDINQFVQSSGGGGIDAHINDAFCDLIESGPKPTVAAVQTMALGGGCELALACNARVCTPGGPGGALLRAALLCVGPILVGVVIVWQRCCGSAAAFMPPSSADNLPRPCLWWAGTSFGLPELQLGIIPGFGGTQRLPRAVGLQKAVEMMLTSTPIKDRAARELGLADEVVPPGQLLEVAKRVAFDIAGRCQMRFYFCPALVVGP